MKNRLFKLLLSLTVALAVILSGFSATAQGNTAQEIIDGIYDYKLGKADVSDTQGWIALDLSKNAASGSEWYIIALSQSGEYDFSEYERALLKYLENNEVYSATSRLKYALTLAACGSGDTYIHTAINNSIGNQGIMSWVYGLHLLNNGYTADGHTAESVIEKLLSLQLADGGWALSGNSGDVDVTAMTLQAIAPYYKSDSEVKASADKAVEFLSDIQEADGGYKSRSVANPESSAQVIVALSALGVDCCSDSRFIKNNNTLFDAVLQFRVASGGFSHTLGGEYNENATIQAYYSSVSYIRMLNGKSGFYILDNADPKALKIPQDTPSKENTESSYMSSGSKTESSAVGSVSQVTASTVTDSVESAVTSASSQSDSTADTSAGENTLSQMQESTLSEAESVESKEHENESAPQKQGSNKPSYKIWVSLGIILLAVGGSLALYFLKIRSKSNFILIAVIAIAAIGFVWLTNFSSVESHYSTDSKKDAVGTVSLTIRCDTVKGSADYIPSDGIILESTEYEIEKGDTVYDILDTAVRENKIHLETSGNADSLYVRGMANLYEFGFGDLSGWMYFVNSKEPSVSCGEYELSDGDKIEWHYTVNMGDDIEYFG